VSKRAASVLPDARGKALAPIEVFDGSCPFETTVSGRPAVEYERPSANDSGQAI
jgi:hypothetical protein